MRHLATTNQTIVKFHIHQRIQPNQFIFTEHDSTKIRRQKLEILSPEEEKIATVNEQSKQKEYLAKKKPKKRRREEMKGKRRSEQSRAISNYRPRVEITSVKQKNRNTKNLKRKRKKLNVKSRNEETFLSSTRFYVGQGDNDRSKFYSKPIFFFLLLLFLSNQIGISGYEYAFFVRFLFFFGGEEVSRQMGDRD